MLPSHCAGGTLQNLYLKLLYSSMQTSADGLNGQRQVSRMTDKKGEKVSFRNVKSEEQARVSAWWFHARAAATGKARSPRITRRVYISVLNNMKLVHWPLMDGLLHLVQLGGPPPRCAKCNSPPTNSQCTCHHIAV